MGKGGGDNALAVRLFYEKKQLEGAEFPSYQCKICRTIRQQKQSGYTNLINHLEDKHKKWKSVVARAKSKQSVVGAMDKWMKKGVDEKYTNIYRWLNWVVKGKQPFSFVANPLNRKYSKLAPICIKTLMKYMNGVFEIVQKKLTKLLPDSFGGIFDGWTCAREHYVAFFATWVTKHDTVAVRLLCCGVQDLPDDADGIENILDVGFTAADIGDYLLNSALIRYGKSFENLEFLTGDNCSVNTALVDAITDWYIEHDKPANVVSTLNSSPAIALFIQFLTM